jgi:hypothetical protein
MKTQYIVPVLIVVLAVGALLMSQSSKTATTFTSSSKAYSVAVPDGWYQHEVSKTDIVFTQSKDFTKPKDTEGYAFGDHLSIREGSFDEIVGAKVPEDYLKGIGATINSESFVERKDVITKTDIKMTRVVLNASEAEGQTLLYVYFPGDRKVITLSHYPYVRGSKSATAFEAMVNSFALPKTATSVTGTTTSSTGSTSTIKDKPAAVPAPVGQRVLGGYIRAINTENPVTIQLDDAVWLTGKTAEDSAIAAGLCTEATRTTCLQNGFFISNPSQDVRSLIISPSAKLTMKTWNTGGAGIQEREIRVDEFAKLIQDGSAKWSKTVPYRVTTDNDIVVKIEELYVP